MLELLVLSEQFGVVADSLEVCAKATVEIFHHFPIYEF